MPSFKNPFGFTGNIDGYTSCENLPLTVKGLQIALGPGLQLTILKVRSCIFEGKAGGHSHCVHPTHCHLQRGHTPGRSVHHAVV